MKRIKCSQCEEMFDHGDEYRTHWVDKHFCEDKYGGVRSPINELKKENE